MKKFRGFDARALKQFCILNVEKMVFGVSMLLVALFIYGALSQPPYAKTPEQLRSDIKAAQDNMQKISEIPPDDLPGDPKFVEVASRARDEVPASGFQTPNPYLLNKNQTMGSRRGEPILLAVQDLEAMPGTGPFALRDPDRAKRITQAITVTDPNQLQPGQPGQINRGMSGAAMPGNTPPKRPTARTPGNRNSLQNMVGGRGGAMPDATMPGGGEYGSGASAMTGVTVARGVQAPMDSIVEGMRWVCVTGLVPYREQLQKYYDEFATAQHQDPVKDVPYWAGVLVERAEVTSEVVKDSSKTKWVKISVKDARDMTTRWAARAGDVVDPTYTDENLTFPLGPLLEKNWGREVAHSKIPVLDITQRGATAGEVTPESAALADLAPRTEGDDLEFMRKRRAAASRAAGAGGMGEMPGGRTIMPRAMQPRAMPGGMPGGYGGYGRGEGSEYGGQRSLRGMPGGEGGASGVEGPQEVEFLLFRFFDFTVEEGKRYRYRVQLVLENPNYRIRPQYLKDAKFNADDFRFSPMSEPSPIASVTSYNEMLVGPVTAAEKSIEEPKANLIVMQLDPKMGTKAVYEIRKAVTARKEKRVILPVPRGQLIQFQADVDVIHPVTQMVEEKTVDFNANQVVLDIRGGERFVPGDMKDRETMPGEVLFMDANGQLSSRSESADALDYLAESQRLEAMRLAKETNSTVPSDTGLPGGEGGEGAIPRRGRAGAGS